MFFTLVFCLMFGGYLVQSDSTQEEEPILVETHSPIIKGALIDDYTDEALVIRLTSPDRMIRDALLTVDKEKTPPETYNNIIGQFGYLERVYLKQYNDILESFQQLIVTPFPTKQLEEKKTFDMTQLSRQKRSPLRALIAFLRAIRPVARVSGKLTKYGRFIKTLKYTGYAASAGVFAYEMADIFGVVPDVKYQQITAELQELHQKRTEDLKVIDKISLVTTSLNDQIKDTTSEFKKLISDVDSLTELKIRGSHLLNNYLSQLTFSLMILLQGKLPTFLISLETQRTWLEQKISSGLLLYISSISPHLAVKLKAIDEINSQLIVQVTVPQPDTRFQLLHYVQWEPKLWIKNQCYSSSIPYLFLAYPSSKSADLVIKKPLLLDPQSCLEDGFLMCESDSILKKIPGLTLNSICSAQPIISRRRRDTHNQFDGPYYNLSGIVEESLMRDSLNEKTRQDIKDIQKEIKDLIASGEQKMRDSKERLEEAEKRQYIYKISFIITITVFFGLLFGCFFMIKGILRKTKHVRSLENELIHLKLRS